MSAQAAGISSTSARRVLGRAVTPILSILGVGVSSYLLWVRVGGSEALCTGFGGCDLVNASRYAVVGGIPVSLIGLIGYLVILVLSLWRARNGPWVLSALIFGMALAGFLYSAYLTYLELFVILAVCPWCVASALFMTGILVDSWRGLEA
ncbi:MAG: vitamin K epoxide reductase family protein [Dehalococcoidia bacterium]|nr:vitamin K epoxide reductase family protein [Dehalococcoidia bacterium]